MDVILSGQSVFARFTRIVHWFVQPGERGTTTQILDAAIQQQIHLIEQSIHDMETRPSMVIRSTSVLTPLTEQQKIIDLAG